jgi:hypothetical protein
MSRSTVIIVLASFIILVPFLGFPRDWEPVIFFLSGGVIIIIELYAVLVRAQESFFRDYEINTDVYSEKNKREHDDFGGLFSNSNVEESRNKELSLFKEEK